MKKIIFFSILFIAIASMVSAQTLPKEIIKKIQAAPANEYGVKRINYGIWQTTEGSKNTWAYYDPKDGLYHLSVIKIGQKYLQDDLILDTAAKDTKIFKDLNPKKWQPVQ